MRALHARDEPRRAHRIEHDDGRDVERFRQRLPDGHGAAIETVEVDRDIAAESGGPVLDQRFGMREAELEGEPVDQRLQRRAGRAHRLGHVDVTAALGLEQAGRADRSKDVAALLIGDDNRDGDAFAHLRRARGGEPFERALQPSVDGQLHLAHGGLRPHGFFGESARRASGRPCAPWGSARAAPPQLPPPR
jgi:hypothetical protein